MAKCDHRYEDGTSCRSPEAFVDPDTGLCRQHGPGAAERMAEQGRKGALATKKRFGGISLPSDRLGPLETIHDAQRWLRLIGWSGRCAATHALRRPVDDCKRPRVGESGIRAFEG